MSDNPRNKDGVERLAARMKLGWKKWLRGTEVYRQEYKKDPINTHKLVNIFTEGERINDVDVEYFLGHILFYLVVSTPVLLGTIGYLLVAH